MKTITCSETQTNRANPAETLVDAPNAGRDEGLDRVRGLVLNRVRLPREVALVSRPTGPGQPDRRIGDPEVQKSYYYTDTGLIAQNVYLFAASQGLAVWFHNCNKDAAARDFKLRPQQRALFAQTVGYPA